MDRLAERTVLPMPTVPPLQFLQNEPDDRTAPVDDGHLWIGPLVSV